MRNFSGQLLLAGSILFLLAACGGGGGNSAGDNSGGGTIDQFSVAGTIFVPSSNILEVEPNDGVGTAQPLVEGNAISGRASAGDAGLPHVTQIDGQAVNATLHDLYKITISEPAQVLLTLAEDDTTGNDLDLYVLDANGKEIDRSIDSISPVELVELSKPGTYLIAVSGFKGQSAYTLAVPTASAPLSFGQTVLPVGAELVPGDIIVKFRQQPEAKAAALHSLSRKAQAAGMQVVEDLPFGATLLKVPERLLLTTTKKSVSKAAPSASSGIDAAKLAKSLSRGRNELKAATIALVQQLRGDPDVEYAEPNFINRAFAVPNDQYYSLQWHYPLIRLPEAWDVTKGDPSVIVAVIDTGILAQHPDLQGQLVPGYDFVQTLKVRAMGTAAMLIQRW